MKKPYLALLFLNYFSTGIIVPVLSLMLIDKGCSLPEIALLMGFYSLTVFVLELPSGILSDMIGRKKIFLISCSLNFIASFSLLFLSGFTSLIPAVIIMGAGRAFSTGSLDALLLDNYIDVHGKEGLPKATTALALIETTGISAGTIIGGFLPVLSKSIITIGTFDLNLISRSVIYTAAIVLTLIFIQENKAPSGGRISLKTHLVSGFKFIKSSPTVILLTLSFMLSGLFIAPLEAYWQPAFTSLLPKDSLLYTVGLVSFGSFAFAALGSISAKRFVLKTQDHLSLKFTVSRLILFGAFIVFSLQKSIYFFSGTFILVYFLFAGSNVIGDTMLNLKVPNSLRASMLSFVSLFFQGGAMLSPLFSSLMAAKTSISFLWLTLGIALVILTSVIGLFLRRFDKNKAAENPAELCSRS